MKEFLINLYFTTDWSATGTMISAITSIILIIATWIIANRQNEINVSIDKNESKREQSRINLSLFDMRFEIYENFMHYYKCCEQINQMDVSIGDDENCSSISVAKEVFARLDSESSLLWMEFVDLSTDFKKAVHSKSKEQHEINDKINEVRAKLYARFFVIRKQLVDTYQKMDFCFDNLEIIQEPVKKLIDFVVFKFLEDDYKSAKTLEANKNEFKKLQEKYNYPKVIEEMKRQIDFREKTCS